MSRCKGKFFRCRISVYIDNRGGHVTQIKMAPMKRMSCKGCAECEPLPPHVGLPDDMSADQIYQLIDGELVPQGQLQVMAYNNFIMKGSRT